jgi:hypothetical protein
MKPEQVKGLEAELYYLTDPMYRPASRRRLII